MISVVDDNLDLSPEDSEFIQYVLDDVTIDGQLPYKVPKRDIVRQIVDSAKFFYKNYWRANISDIWGLIKKEDIKKFLTNNGSTPFREVISYHVTLPPKVRVVSRVFDRGDQIDTAKYNGGGSLSESLSWNTSYYSTTNGGNLLFGIDRQLYVEQSVCQITNNNVYESCCSTMVDFHFNPVTKDMFINKELKTDLIINYKADIDLKYLYQDDLFRRYVLAKTRAVLRRLIGSHTIDLPGGGTLNVDEVCNTDDIEKVEEIINGGKGIGDIIIQRQ